MLGETRSSWKSGRSWSLCCLCMYVARESRTSRGASEHVTHRERTNSELTKSLSAHCKLHPPIQNYEQTHPHVIILRAPISCQHLKTRPLRHVQPMARGLAQHPVMWLARASARSLGAIFRAVYKLQQKEEVEIRDAGARVCARGALLPPNHNSARFTSHAPFF